MYLTRLSVQGFRSLKDVTWEPGKLNVVIGPNGSGKTNILKLLKMIQYSAKGELQEYIQRSGGANSISWDGEAKSIQYEITVQDDFQIDGNKIYYFLDLNTSDSSWAKITNETLESFIISYNIRNRFEAVFQVGEETVKKWEIVNPSESILSQSRGHFVFDYPMPEFGNYLTTFWMSSIVDTSENSKIRDSAVARYEKKIDTDGQNLINILHTLYSENRDFKKIVNDSMQAAFGDDFDELIFPPASDQRVQMRIRWKSLKREQSAADMSDGTLRFLFLLAVLANPEPAPLIAIDEPETGLHPSMMPLIAELAVEASKKTQVIFTTHSDQFLDAFRDTRPTTTVAKWEDGQTKLHIVDDDELKHFLKDYSLGALFRSGELESEFLARRQDAA